MAQRPGLEPRLVIKPGELSRLLRYHYSTAAYSKPRGKKTNCLKIIKQPRCKKLPLATGLVFCFYTFSEIYRKRIASRSHTRQCIRPVQCMGLLLRFLMVGKVGIEPTSSGFSDQCSDLVSYFPIQ